MGTLFISLKDKIAAKHGPDIGTAFRQVEQWQQQNLPNTAGPGRYQGSSNGAPTKGSYLVGDFVDDPTNNTFWLCTVGGTPGTWVQGKALTTGTAGGDLSGTYPNPTLNVPYGRVFATSQVQIISPNSATAFSTGTLDAATNGFTFSNPNLIAPRTGRYCIGVNAVFQVSGVGPGPGRYEAQIWVNGAQVRTFFYNEAGTGGGGDYANPHGSSIVSVSAGQGIAMVVYQTSGGNAGLGLNSTIPLELWAYWIGN